MSATRIQCLVCGLPEAWCTCPRHRDALPSLLPWEAVTDDYGTGGVFVVDAADWVIAEVRDGRGRQDPPEPPRTPGDVWANAVLLAAAPELLDLLRKMLPTFERETDALAEAHRDPLTGRIEDEIDGEIGKEVGDRRALLATAAEVLAKIQEAIR